MKHIQNTLILSFALLALTACASKKKVGPPPLPPEKAAILYDRFLGENDQDGDGLVTCSDIQTLRSALFRKLDTDSNRALDEQEYRRAQFEDKAFMFHSFESLDHDLDRLLGVAEFVTVSDSNFRSMDKNADCTISREEAVEMLQIKRYEQRGQPDRLEPKSDRSRRKKPDADGGVDPF